MSSRPPGPRIWGDRAYPRLEEDQLARLFEFGVPRNISPGQFIFRGSGGGCRTGGGGHGPHGRHRPRGQPATLHPRSRSDRHGAEASDRHSRQAGTTGRIASRPEATAAQQHAPADRQPLHRHGFPRPKPWGRCRPSPSGLVAARGQAVQPCHRCSAATRRTSMIGSSWRRVGPGEVGTSVRGSF